MDKNLKKIRFMKFLNVFLILKHYLKIQSIISELESYQLCIFSGNRSVKYD